MQLMLHKPADVTPDPFLPTNQTSHNNNNNNKPCITDKIRSIQFQPSLTIQ